MDQALLLKVSFDQVFINLSAGFGLQEVMSILLFQSDLVVVDNVILMVPCEHPKDPLPIHLDIVRND